MKNSRIQGQKFSAGKIGDGLSRSLTLALKKHGGAAKDGVVLEEPIEIKISKPHINS